MKLKQELLIQPSAFDDIWKQTRLDLNEDAKTKDRDLELIKEWLRKEPHLPDEFDESALRTFLRGSNYSMEKCKRKLDMYFTMRAACPELFSNRDPTAPRIAELLRDKVQGPPLPGLTPNGRRVTICRGLHQDLTSVQITDILKLALMIGDVRLIEEKEGVSGDVHILDAAILGPSLLGRLTPSVIKKFLISVQEAYPVKLKEVHIINTAPIVERFISIVKPFLKEKIRNRIYVHKELKDLYKHVPQEMLPKEYGGDCGSLDDIHGRWVETLTQYRDWFLAQENIKVNESLRHGKPKNYEELFGIDGTFRQLSID